ncbi:MAG: hypothetical protein E7000_09620, partial [Coriobacteriaceae bacterium]|nr:hypothetical protein [Coriobacteriaceae bacterium]
MRQFDEHTGAPTNAIWLRFLLLVPLIIVLAVTAGAHIRANCATLDVKTLPVNLTGETKGFGEYGLDDITYDTPGVVEATDIEYAADGSARITFRAVRDGETGVTFGDQNLSTYWFMQVKDGAVV